MHVPDGFLDPATSAGTAVVALAGVSACVRKTAGVLDDRQVPLAGLTAAFVFAAQMLNFPVAAGTSGHLIGGTLAAVLVGPWLGALCVAVVLVVQALLFADGGITALGTNVTNMALVTAFGGYVVFLGLRRLLPATRSSLVAASGVAAGLAVVASSLAFTVEYAIGGSGGVAIDRVAAAMVSVHVLIGIGEGVITALAVSAVLSSRPDLVHGATSLARLSPSPEANRTTGVALR